MSGERLISVGIDGSNLRSGGGVTHLVELLRAANPVDHGVGRVVLWGSRVLLDRIPDAPWLECVHQPALDGALAQRLWWQNVRLDALARNTVDLLFVPGGNYAGRFRPFVTMSRNLLPFQPVERRRYGLASARFAKLVLLRRSQAATMRRAAGVIFLTDYSRQTVMAAIGHLACDICTIAHGVDERFRHEPRAQKPILAYDDQRPFRLLYVSTVDVYKHQWHVASAVAALRQRGIPVAIDFVGAAYGPALARLQRVMGRVDPDGRAIRYVGPVPHAELPAVYRAADAVVFASTCETMSNILLEAMASGLPLAISDHALNHEVVGDAALYFQPERPDSIEQVVGELLREPARRAALAAAGYRRAAQSSWRACARDTFEFLARVARRSGVAAPASEVPMEVHA